MAGEGYAFGKTFRYNTLAAAVVCDERPWREILENIRIKSKGIQPLCEDPETHCKRTTCLYEEDPESCSFVGKTEKDYRVCKYIQKKRELTL